MQKLSPCLYVWVTATLMAGLDDLRGLPCPILFFCELRNYKYFMQLSQLPEQLREISLQKKFSLTYN